MNVRSQILAAALLGLSAFIAPGGGAQAAGLTTMAAMPSDMLAASAFGVSVGTGRGVRVGVVVGAPKAVGKRRVLMRRVH
jgi:hypothetical protein